MEYAPWARCDGVCVICLFVLYGARTVVCVCRTSRASNVTDLVSVVVHSAVMTSRPLVGVDIKWSGSLFRGYPKQRRLCWCHLRPRGQGV